MKKSIALFCAVLLWVPMLLSGCVCLPVQRYFEPAQEATLPIETTEPVTEPAVEITEATQPEIQLPYTVALDAEVCVFSFADPQAPYVQTVGFDGVYTIVDVLTLSSGDTWGLLKSGAGWVNLTNPRFHGANAPAVTVSYASQTVLNGTYYLAAIHSDDPYRSNVSFCAHQTVTDLTITAYDVGTSTPGDALYTRQTLTPDTPLVAHLSFPGDFSTFLLTYTDGAGVQQRYLLSQSGLDGSIIAYQK